MTLNQQFEQIRQSATVAMNDRILAYRAAGNRVVQLQVGDPDFATPPAVLEVAFDALQSGLTHYGPSRGYPDLRAAAAS
jgi:aspartate aminotransferase